MKLTDFVTHAFSLALVHSSTCILFNQFSGRCIYIDNESTEVPILDERSNAVNTPTWNVYALPCTWDTENDDKTVRSRSMPEEWMEIIPVPEFPDMDMNSRTDVERRYSIRKLTLEKRDDDVCIVSRKFQALAVASTCNSTDAQMKLQIQVNMTKKQGHQFQVLDLDGRCLTTQLGKETLIFRECTRRYSLQQRWLVCRHNMICDTDLTWSPRKITFKNESKSKNETDDNGNSTLKNAEHPPSSSSSSPPSKNDCEFQKGYVQNEVLYSIQNGLQIYGSGEDFVVSSIAAFYPLQSLREAHELTMRICREDKLNCVPCNIYSWKNENEISITKWLVSWIDKCNNEESSKRVFLSRNVLHVPHFFPRGLQHEGKNEMQKGLITNLKKYLAELEEAVEEMEKHENGNKESQGFQKTTTTTTTEINDSFGESNSNSQFPLTDLDIDIRFGSSHNSKNVTKVGTISKMN